MFKHMANFILGILVVLMPFSGFPRSWKTFLLVIFGMLIAFFSYLARREGKKNSAVLSQSIQKDLPKQQSEYTEKKIIKKSIPETFNLILEKKETSLPENAKPFFYSAYDSFEEVSAPVSFTITPPVSILEEQEVATAIPILVSDIPTPPRRKKKVVSLSSSVESSPSRKKREIKSTEKNDLVIRKTRTRSKVSQTKTLHEKE